MRNKNIDKMLTRINESLTRLFERDYDYDDYDYDTPSWRENYLYYNIETGEHMYSSSPDEIPEKDGDYVIYELTVSDYHMENDGIGSYEFWGAEVLRRRHELPGNR